ncbi:MATE family efflux transporter [Effusibacillus lacus]|uniref:Probable multidrug resistance protein NorM n=1 Tax=Effusibacillus lacus TaxID=1348429 RepID=A0A292YRW5_9BACL|nr:MATE family efflux transporter [Effusibacillus lacus]TCS75001.1 putative MATE family efflux protein [Effusibacillus lacus]GAX91669.1 MATE family efflux transporter [Effusibacillus lacus]
MKTEPLKQDTGRQRKNKWKAILALALPAIGETFFQSMVGFVDTFFVSKLGLVEVAAVGVTNAILQIYFSVFMALGVASTVMIANQVGEGNIPRARHIAKQSILLAGWIGLFFGIITFIFASPILKMMGAAEIVLEPAVIYFRTVATPSIFISLMFILGSVLRGAGDTKSPMKVSLWINLLHILLDYILIFGIAGFGALGLLGAGLATVIVRLLGTILLWRALTKYPVGAFSLSGWKIDKEIIKKFLKLGGPAAGERLSMRIGQVIYFGMILRMGTYTYAAHQLAGNFTIFGYMAGYGLATAATTLVGQSLGAKKHDEAREYAKASTFIGMFLLTGIGIMVYVLLPWVIPYFTVDTAVINQVRIALGIDVFNQVALAVVLILTGVLQAGGDTKYPMYTTTIGIWAFRTFGVYLLGVYLGWGLAGVWIAIGLDNGLRAILLYLRFRSNRWIQISG